MNMNAVTGILLFIVSSSLLLRICSGVGSMASIAISYGDNPIICAIEASHEQQILCWGRNATIDGTESAIPPLMALSGGSGFICGLQATGNNQAFCFRSNLSVLPTVMSNMVPEIFQGLPYASIAAGESHVCALRAPMDRNRNLVDCWGDEFVAKVPETDEETVAVVSGKRFSCALGRRGAAICWGDDSSGVVSGIPEQNREGTRKGVLFQSISAGGDHVCGIEKSSRVARCWGKNDRGQLNSPQGIQFAIVAAGLAHTCGIRSDNHEVECWGSEFGPHSRIPAKTSFLGIASGGEISCGIREKNLLADCWNGTGNGSSLEYTAFSPPLELFSPGICSPVSCSSDEFAFNASNHGVPEVDGLCRNNQLHRICSPCATTCPNGTFLSSPCGLNEDRLCVECSLCETDACEKWCTAQGIVGMRNSSESNQIVAREERSQRKTSILIVTTVSASFLFVVLLVVLRKRITIRRTSSSGEPDASNPGQTVASKQPVIRPDIQIFRLADLRDATNGFKELNEIGRGSYGIVYKAVLPDGSQLAVKRASAVRRIECSNKDFEAELEIVCRMRHENLVNLVGYCDQMGERLLAYEFMHNGSLHEHLHDEHSCPVATSWGVRLAIAAQAAKGIEFLHRSKPPVVHGNIKSANIMLDREWKARISDLGLSLFSVGGESCWSSGFGAPEMNPYADRPFSGQRRPNPISRDEETGEAYSAQCPQFDGLDAARQAAMATEYADVYSFGVVLLEILTGRKAVTDSVLEPPVRLVDWAAPTIARGRFDALLDPKCCDNAHSSSKQGIVRVAEIVAMCVAKVASERPSMAEVARWLQELVDHQNHHHHQHHQHHQVAMVCRNFRDSH